MEISIQTIADIVGVVGVGMIVVAYFLLVNKTLHSDGGFYLSSNLLGSAMILFSVFYAWNLAAFVIQVFWIAVSAYGLVKLFLPRKRC